MLLFAIVAMSIVAARSSRSALLDQVDEDLRGVELRLNSRIGALLTGRPLGDATTTRGFAYLLVDETGTIVEASPSGFVDAPDPLPADPELDVLVTTPGSISTISSADGSLDYRAIAVSDGDGHVRIAAAPIDDLDGAVSQLIRWLVISGATLVIGGAAATWLVVRRGLRPVDDMVDTAASIAQGDLTRRIPEHDRATELGQLGTALNDMLSQLDSAFTQERESQQRLNQFVADASHELRTPLATLQGYADLYHAGALEDPVDLDNALGRIRKESARMQRLVDDLLLLARLDRGQPLNLGDVDLAALIRDATTDSRAIEPDRPVTYDGPTSLAVDGDEQRLAQVITNLLANARAHTPPRTPVHIIVGSTTRAVTIDVIDQGPGIDPEHRDKLFDRFHRGKLSPALNPGGTGLGLSIVAAIIEAHDGTITAANDPDHGARFTITLPAATRHAAPESGRP